MKRKKSARSCSERRALRSKRSGTPTLSASPASRPLRSISGMRTRTPTTLSDAHDIVYCLENAEDGLEAAAKKCKEARAGKHAQVIDEALAILRKRFADDGTTEGYRKDGS